MTMKDPKIITESDLSDVSVPLAVPVVSAQVLPDIEKINNVAQKEKAIARAGLSRYRYMLVIADALEANKWIDEPDVQGNIRRVQIPDAPRRQWAVEQAAKLFGDYVTQVNADIKVSHSVEQLINVFSKARLKDG